MGMYRLQYADSTVREIEDMYIALRMRGHNRETAVDTISERYQAELIDHDERPYIYTALALALCRKNELTEDLRKKATEALSQLSSHTIQMHSAETALEYRGIAEYIKNRTGPEAPYSVKKRYIPQWRIGDTFIHPFSQDKAAAMGLIGWNIVIRKVGEYTGQDDRFMQLVYLTLCPHDAVPLTDHDLQSLGFLRMMEHDHHQWDYLCQLTFSGKKDEDRWQLTRIGNFKNAGHPRDAATENPEVCMPLFGTLHRHTSHLDYEDMVCSLIKTIGANQAIDIYDLSSKIKQASG